MNIKGLDPLRKHIPDLNSPLGVLRLFLLPISLIFLVTAFLNNRTLTSPFWLLGSEAIFGGVGFLLLYLFIRFKNDFKARFGSLAYSRGAGRLAYPGVAVISAVVARIRSIPGPEFPHMWQIVLTPLGWVLIAVGLLLFLRVLQALGLDTLVMLYVYFPEESRLVNQKIYDLLRHPAYSSAQRIAFGLALLNGNWFALACAMAFALGLWSWVYFVEEKELIERFGPGYLEYRRRVPAFYPRFHNLGKFYEFLISGR